MLFSYQKNNDGLFRLPPELLIQIFADVAVHRPDTFFSLGLVGLEWKDFLSCYRKSIVNDIAKYVKYGVGPVLYTSYDDTEIYSFFMVSLPHVVPRYVHYINDQLPILIVSDPIMLRRVKFLFEWAIDIAVLPWWLPLSVKLSYPMFSQMLQTVLTGYINSYYEIDSDLVLSILFACEPGDPDNLNVYEAFKAVGISFVTKAEIWPLVFLQHLVIIRRSYGIDTYVRHLKALVSIGLDLNITTMVDIYEFNYPWATTELNELFVAGEKDCCFVRFDGAHSIQTIKHIVSVESLSFWHVWYDLLMLNSPPSERERIHDEFHIELYKMSVYWILNEKIWDYCFKWYPGGVTRDALQLGINDTLDFNNPVFIQYLLKRGYDMAFLAQLILSVDGDWKFGSLRTVFEEEPLLKKVFYEECKKRGAFVIGFLVNASNNLKGDYHNIPMDFYVTAAERYETAPLYLLIKTRDIDFIEYVLREFVYCNVPASLIVWYLETMYYFLLLHPQFLEDMIELSASLQLKETFEALLKYKESGESPWPISVTTKRFTTKRDNKLITDYFQPIVNSCITSLS